MSVRQLSPELAKIAHLELNEEPNRVQDDIKNLKEWINKQPHLNARTDDQWLLSFLRGCKFSLERAKVKLDLFYTMRTTAADITRKLKPTDAIFRELLSAGAVVVLPPSKDPLVPTVTLIRPAALDYNKHTSVDLVALLHATNRILLADDDTATVVGTKTLLDLEGMSVSHVMAMSPTTLKKMVVLGQDAMPLRLKGAHYLNLPAGFDMFFNLLKTFLNEKSKSRYNIHNRDYNDLHKHIPVEILPTEYGGKAGSIKELNEKWTKKILARSDWLLEDENFGTDESRRVGAPKTAETMFGVEGSFRQLEFD